MRILSRSVFAAALVVASAFVPGRHLLAQAQQVPPTTKQVPPKGVAIADADRAELTAGAAALKAEIDAIAAEKKAASVKLLPDVEVFWKAVDWALRYDELFNVKEVAAAKALLAEGVARAKALRAGESPWTSATGLVVRGFRSRIDGSVQPYGVVIPPTWKAGDTRLRRTWIWNHGRGDTISELAFINGRIKQPGDFTPEDTIVVHPYGRFCNATKFAGETDVFEALDAAAASYPVDRERIMMTGFSMGGASVWHLATHHAGLWAGASPGAGFAETPIYTKAFADGKEPPAWWEQQLWHLYNATDYAANLFNCPTIAYSGELDAQKQSADLMEKAAADEGLKLERLVGPGVGHKYEPETKKVLQRRLEELAAKGREALPAKVRLVTYTLRYNTQKWVTVDAMEKHWERAEVTAELADEGTIKATTKNVAALTFDMQGGTVPLEKTHPPRVILDGQELNGPAVTSPWHASFVKTVGKWALAPASHDEGTALHKRHGLQGPIDDAFMDSFVFVRPTGKAMNETTGAWVKTEIERAAKQWRTVFRGDVRIVDDTAVTPELMASANLVLWGDPASNKVLAQALPKLPIQWTAETVTVGKETFPAATSMPVLIYPNPLAGGKRYVVLNSSFTFRQGSDTTNALQVPNLPDWAVIDLRTPPSPKWPGLVVDAGFFDEAWQQPAK